MYSSSWESIPRRLQWVAPTSAPNGHTEKAPWAQLGFHIWVGRASQQDIFISKVILDSDAHWAGLQEGDQVLAVKDVDFQNVEHSKATEILKTAGKASMHVCFFFFFFVQLSSSEREDCALERCSPQPSMGSTMTGWIGPCTNTGETVLLAPPWPSGVGKTGRQTMHWVSQPTASPKLCCTFSCLVF